MILSTCVQLVNLLTDAHRHAVQHQYGAAGQLLSKAAIHLPLDTDVHLCLAGMHLKAGCYHSAVSDYTSSI